MNNKTQLLLATFCLFGPLLISAQLTADNLKICEDRSGLVGADLVDIRTRNQECTIDCITRQGLIQTYHAKHKSPCSEGRDRRCILGNCLTQDEENKIDVDDLIELEIDVLSAFVPDEDDLPGAGGSDVFVTVQVAENGYPHYRKNDFVCWTWVVQDNNFPKWNFKCKPLTMMPGTLLKFQALDSDKPFKENPDKIGSASLDVSTLLEKGRTKLRLEGAYTNDRNYYIEVEVRGKRLRDLDN